MTQLVKQGQRGRFGTQTHFIERLVRMLTRMNLTQQFTIISLIILIVSMLIMGWWVAQQIENSVVARTSGQTALYVDSFIDPPLQELANGSSLSQEHIQMLNRIVAQTPLGQQIVAFKVWDTTGRTVYSTNPAQIGQAFPIKDELARAIQGEVTSDISNLQDAENLLDRSRWHRLLETYSPIAQDGTSRVIGVVEFYQTVDALDKETRAAQISSWLLVGGVTLAVFSLLSIFVRRANNTIESQRTELSQQVVRLTELLAQNQELHDRISRAAARTTTVNERYLRRISAELHDGPAQDLGLALLRLDRVIAQTEGINLQMPDNSDCHTELSIIQDSVRSALQETRAISNGLGVPELDRITLADAVLRAVNVHQRRTGSRVISEIGSLPEQAPLSVKITLYRLIQEALTNAFRHAKGKGQRVSVDQNGDNVHVVISDEGPGFVSAPESSWDDHLGLIGMRERVESLGGVYEVHSTPGTGTTITAVISLIERS